MSGFTFTAVDFAALTQCSALCRDVVDILKIEAQKDKSKIMCEPMRMLMRMMMMFMMPMRMM